MPATTASRTALIASAGSSNCVRSIGSPTCSETGCRVTWDSGTGGVYADGKPLRSHTFLHDYYFMAGDNVMDSSDSRNWGLVPGEYIVGVVTRITYSRDRRTGRLRKDRTWKNVAAGGDGKQERR